MLGLSGGVVPDQLVEAALRQGVHSADAVEADEHRLAGLGDDEAGHELTNLEARLALDGLVGLEGLRVIAPCLVQATRTRAVVLMPD